MNAAQHAYTVEEIASLANVCEHEAKEVIAQLELEPLEIYSRYNAGIAIKGLVKRKLKHENPN